MLLSRPIFVALISDVRSLALINALVLSMHKRLDDILAEPEAHFAAQRLYRQHILLEQERFDLEVRASFFTRV